MLQRHGAGTFGCEKKGGEINKLELCNWTKSVLEMYSLHSLSIVTECKDSILLSAGGLSSELCSFGKWLSIYVQSLNERLVTNDLGSNAWNSGGSAALI